MKTVAFIPIKENSERLPGKNFIQLGNVPLFMHIVNTALKSSTLDEIYIFSNVDFSKYNLPDKVQVLKRNPCLDSNFTNGVDIWFDFANKVFADIYVLLHATAPFIRTESINKSVEFVKSGDFDSVFTVRRIQTYVWHNNKPLNFEAKNIRRTQDLTPVFIETSGFYVYKRNIILKNKSRIGSNPYLLEVDEKEAIDIDYEEDYIKAVRLL